MGLRPLHSFPDPLLFPPRLPKSALDPRLLPAGTLPPPSLAHFLPRGSRPLHPPASRRKDPLHDSSVGPGRVERRRPTLPRPHPTTSVRGWGPGGGGPRPSTRRGLGDRFLTRPAGLSGVLTQQSESASPSRYSVKGTVGRKRAFGPALRGNFHLHRPYLARVPSSRSPSQWAQERRAGPCGAPFANTPSERWSARGLRTSYLRFPTEKRKKSKPPDLLPS